jgi:hypothetical protein
MADIEWAAVMKEIVQEQTLTAMRLELQKQAADLERHIRSGEASIAASKERLFEINKQLEEHGW